jgi:hypothetical protein
MAWLLVPVVMSATGLAVAARLWSLLRREQRIEAAREHEAADRRALAALWWDSLPEDQRPDQPWGDAVHARLGEPR